MIEVVFKVSNSYETNSVKFLIALLPENMIDIYPNFLKETYDYQIILTSDYF